MAILTCRQFAAPLTFGRCVRAPDIAAHFGCAMYSYPDSRDARQALQARLEMQVIRPDLTSFGFTQPDLTSQQMMDMLCASSFDPIRPPPLHVASLILT